MSACIGIEIFEQILASDKNKARSRATHVNSVSRRRREKEPLINKDGMFQVVDVGLNDFGKGKRSTRR